MRHAKSDWDADYDTDHQRPLNTRGVRSSRLIGRLVAGMDLVPELVISSTALRAVATTENAVAAGHWESRIEFEDGFYGAGPEVVLDLASRAAGVERLMLVGHQPTWSMLVLRLTGGAADMKTATVAVIEVMLEEWSELPRATGMLTSLINPRPFFGSDWDLGN